MLFLLMVASLGPSGLGTLDQFACLCGRAKQLHDQLASVHVIPSYSQLWAWSSLVDQIYCSTDGLVPGL